MKVGRGKYLARGMYVKYVTLAVMHISLLRREDLSGQRPINKMLTYNNKLLLTCTDKSNKYAKTVLEAVDIMLSRVTTDIPK